MMSGFKLKSPYPDLDALSETPSDNPNHLSVEPTNRCNTRCIFCGHYDDMSGDDMSEQVFQKIVSQLLGHAQSIDLTGYGEPLIARHFDSMQDECARHGVAFSLTTNGLKLRNDELIAKLVRADMVLRLSIDGARPETFEFARPFIKWETMVGILENLKRHATEAGREKHFQLQFHFVAMKKNIADLPDMVRLAKQYSSETIRILPMGYEQQFERIRGQSLHDCPELIGPPLTEALTLGAELGVELEVPASFREMLLQYNKPREHDNTKQKSNSLHQRFFRRGRLALNYLHRRGFKRLGEIALHGFGPKAKTGAAFCLLPWQETYLAADGAVYACCRMTNKLGNLNDQEWKDIWEGDAYRLIRRTIHSWNPSAVCRYCQVPCGINGGDEHQYERFLAQFKKIDVPLDAPEASWGEGFYELERKADGSPSHRWMDKRGTLTLPKTQGARFLGLSINPYSPFPEPIPGQGQINKGPSEPFDNT